MGPGGTSDERVAVEVDRPDRELAARHRDRQLNSSGRSSRRALARRVSRRQTDRLHAGARRARQLPAVHPQSVARLAALRRARAPPRQEGQEARARISWAAPLVLALPYTGWRSPATLSPDRGLGSSRSRQGRRRRPRASPRVQLRRSGLASPPCGALVSARPEEERGFPLTGA